MIVNNTVLLRKISTNVLQWHYQQPNLYISMPIKSRSIHQLYIVNSTTEINELKITI